VRYGRSHTRRRVHHTTVVYLPVPSGYATPSNTRYPAAAAPFADSRLNYNESHTIVDFGAGRDVGLGLFGRDSSSVFNVGVRFAQFSAKTAVNISGRPNLTHYLVPPKYLFNATGFHQYVMTGQAQRDFHGIGPSFSFKASIPIVGNPEGSELFVDWGINGAVLFGRQTAKTSHATKADFMPPKYSDYATPPYLPRIVDNPERSRSVVVPNLGGFAGFSVKYPNAKISLGYRADFFFGAIDAGIDERQEKNLGFHGPFASISLGLG